jgi:hypothetical protein
MSNKVHQSCAGGPAYRTKAQAIKAEGEPVKRCHRCKWWHGVHRGRR